MITTTILKEVFVVKRTQIEMMIDRGWNDVDDSILKMSYGDFYKKYSERNTKEFLQEMSSTHTQEGRRKMYISYLIPLADKNSVSKDQIKELLEYIIDKNIYHIMLITQAKISANASSSINKIIDRKFERFLFDDLKINITKHVLVPKHTLATKEEEEEYVRYFGDKNKMKRILTIDAIQKYYDFPVGSIVKIERKYLVYPTISKVDIDFRVVAIPNIDDISILADDNDEFESFNDAIDAYGGNGDAAEIYTAD